MMLGFLLVLFGTSAHASEPVLIATIEAKKRVTPWNELYTGDTFLVVEFRVDSDRTADVRVECVFHIPRLGMVTTHVAQGQAVAGIPSYGRFRQRVPTGFVGYDGEDWDVECEARPH